jgi:hypothetical protein
MAHSESRARGKGKQPEILTDTPRRGPRDDRDPVPGTDGRVASTPEALGEELREPAHTIEPPSVPDGTFVKVRAEDHPLARACEVSVNFQDYHRSSSKLGRFGKIVGIDVEDGEYLVMLDNYECLAVPMRRVEWRKVAT